MATIGVLRRKLMPRTLKDAFSLKTAYSIRSRMVPIAPDIVAPLDFLVKVAERSLSF
jgi:hypothetical protein